VTADLRLTPKAQRDVEELWKLRHEAVQILTIVVAEWKTDPTSVQCFDLRLVKRAEELLDRIKKLDVFGGSY
jgi:hypothetical protein